MIKWPVRSKLSLSSQVPLNKMIDSETRQEDPVTSLHTLVRGHCGRQW